MLAGGFVLGLKWESNNATAILVDLEQQVQQKPAAAVPPVSKHGKTATR
jgi:hypothetical protein